MEPKIKSFLKTSIIFTFVLIILISIIGLIVLYLFSKYTHAMSMILISIASITIIIFSYLISSIVNIYKKKVVPKNNFWIFRTFINAVYPLLEITASILRLDKEQLKLFIIEINNIFINSIEYKVPANDILVLTPHCLQNSNCNIKITNSPQNCKRCGKCDIKDLVELSEKYGIKFYIASGGTFARKVIKDVKPKFIISVACERDLLSGIMDITTIPVIGIVNARPNGPCNNTHVDACKVEEAICKVIAK